MSAKICVPKWPQEVITPSEGFSKQITQSDWLSSLWLVFDAELDWFLGLLHFLQFDLEPKLSSPQLQIQSPGFGWIVFESCGFPPLGALHFRHWFRDAKLISLQAYDSEINCWELTLQAQSPDFTVTAFESFSLLQPKQFLREAKFTLLQEVHIQSPVNS